MSVKLRSEEYDLAVRFIQACEIHPRKWTDPVRITDAARGVLAEVDTREKEARLHDYEDDDILDEDYDDNRDDDGNRYRVSPAETFLLFVGRITGAMVQAAVRRHDNSLTGESGAVLDALDAVSSGIHWAEQQQPVDLPGLRARVAQAEQRIRGDAVRRYRDEEAAAAGFASSAEAVKAGVGHPLSEEEITEIVARYAAGAEVEKV
jgi:hypothetical protein